jgi:hypothetical protein
MAIGFPWLSGEISPKWKNGSIVSREGVEEDMENRRPYKSKKGIALWWPKDGCWHIALPCPDPDPMTGLTTGGYHYVAEDYHTKEDAISAIKQR